MDALQILLVSLAVALATFAAVWMLIPSAARQRLLGQLRGRLPDRLLDTLLPRGGCDACGSSTKPVRR